MARYRKVQVAMWADDKFRSLSRPTPNAQSLWQYLLTCPESTAIPGVIIAGRAGMSEALEWDIEGFDKAFREVFQKAMAKADWKARLIFLPHAIEHNPPESPNVVKSWGKVWPEVPQCALKDEILQELKAFVEGLGEAFRKAFVEAFGKAMPNQEQEQEQEQEEEIGDDVPPSAPDEPEDKIPDCPHQAIIDLYHETLPMLRRVREWTSERQAILRARWREKPERQSLDWWRWYFGLVRESEFLREGRFTDLEWLIRPKNMPKVLEGKYAGEQRRRPSAGEIGRIPDGVFM